MAVPQASPHNLYRGDVKMKKPSMRLKVVPNIVETYKYGNATVRIADNFIRTEPEEIDKVVKELYAVAWAIVMSSRAKGVDI